MPFTLIGQTVEVARRRGRLHIAHRGSVVAEISSACGPGMAQVPSPGPPAGSPPRSPRRGRAAPPVKASAWSEDAIHPPL